jgi:hypothetical protein
MTTIGSSSGSIRLVLAGLAVMCTASAAERRGLVSYGEITVPGVIVTASQGTTSLVAITDQSGVYSFPDLTEGVWTFQVQMLCFNPIRQDVTITPGAAAPNWKLELLQCRTPEKDSPSGDLRSSRNAVEPAAGSNSAPTTIQSEAGHRIDELSERATDGLLIDGTINNSAGSAVAEAAAFGNNRPGSSALYNGMASLSVNSSALNARPFSFTGQDTPVAPYSRLQGAVNFGGPLRIPHLIHNGPIFFIAYQRVRNQNANTTPALVPTVAQRSGSFSPAVPLLDPLTQAPFPGNQLPASRISPQAAALLQLYPLPNLAGSDGYNFQAPLVAATHQDSVQARLNKTLNDRNQLYGGFGFQRTAADNPDIFGFLDKSNSTGAAAQANWTRRMFERAFLHLQVQFSRFSSRGIPYFSNRENISEAAGIAGNSQAPVDWGPPNLTFASGITPLTDAIPSDNRNQTTAFSADTLWIHGHHSIKYGADLRRLEFNYLSQQNPRGTFTFTGAATALSGPAGATGYSALGSDFADFLLGVPDTVQLAFGNADKYFRSTEWDAFVTDDWRISPALTITGGIRWEYSSPITEQYGRLVNLDLAHGFAAVAPVIGASPVGPLTGNSYPSSLVRPDKGGFEPRIGVAWRPIPTSTLVVRAGYGVYYNSSVYQSIALQMAQQSPLSRSLSLQNSSANPLTLATGFNTSPAALSNTFGIDPNFRIGYAQNWQLSVQKDLPGSLVITATYLGIKGTRGPQEFLPNTYPAGAINPCPLCPSGFIYMTSNGNSSRESGQLQLRRRLRSGFSASLDYTFAKSIDDSALGGRGQGIDVVAQNWLNLSAERALSNFDQRQVVSFQTQYTTGMGLRGGTLLGGWRGALLKEWTVTSAINAASGLPLTPLLLSTVSGTGITGPIRPDYTGAPIYLASGGSFLNPAAYVPAPSGQWGNAGRNTITGPAQFSLNASIGRIFRLREGYNLEARLDAVNPINHVTFGGWDTTVNSPRFGVPTSAAAMRSFQITVTVRF